MDNQHRKIAGYRELSQADIDMMNTIKGMGPLLEGLLMEVGRHVADQRRQINALNRDADKATTVEAAAPFVEAARAEQQRLDAAQPERWAAIARTHFQEGLMALTRAVAQPTFF